MPNLRHDVPDLPHAAHRREEKHNMETARFKPATRVHAFKHRMLCGARDRMDRQICRGELGVLFARQQGPVLFLQPPVSSAMACGAQGCYQQRCEVLATLGSVIRVWRVGDRDPRVTLDLHLPLSGALPVRQEPDGSTSICVTTITGKIQKFIMRQQSVEEWGLQTAAGIQAA